MKNIIVKAEYNQNKKLSMDHPEQQVILYNYVDVPTVIYSENKINKLKFY